MLAGCPESVVPSGETTLYPVDTLPVRTLFAGRGARHLPGDPGMREWIRSSPARAESVTKHMIQAADHDIEVGLDLLRQALSSPADALEETCDQVLRTVLAGRSADDIVLMLARTAALGAGQGHTWRLPPDPAAVARARKLAGGQLTAWGLTEAAFTTELIVGELVTNALRYGGAPIELRLIRDSALICEVPDGSNTAPHLRRARVFDEGGRGLLLVAPARPLRARRSGPNSRCPRCRSSEPPDRTRPGQETGTSETDCRHA